MEPAAAAEDGDDRILQAELPADGAPARRLAAVLAAPEIEDDADGLDAEGIAAEVAPQRHRSSPSHSAACRSSTI